MFRGDNEATPFRGALIGLTGRLREIAEVHMSWVSIPLLCASASFATAGEPKAPAPPAPAPPPVAVVMPPVEFRLAPQPVYGRRRGPVPAHQLALVEYREAITEFDPRVAGFAQLLGQLTGRYVEDAAGIVGPTVMVCQELRARKQDASPAQILQAALTWKRPAGSRPGVPRKFSEYIRLYRHFRVAMGKDHQAALALMNPTKPAVPPRARP